jgi:hypothetical protein
VAGGFKYHVLLRKRRRRLFFSDCGDVWSEITEGVALAWEEGEIHDRELFLAYLWSDTMLAHMMNS